jgi:hypothetical protein
MNCRRTACVANYPANRNENDVGKQVLTISEVPRAGYRLEIRTNDARVHTLRLGYTTPRAKYWSRRPNPHRSITSIVTLEQVM